MNSYTAVNVNNGKVCGRIVTVGATSITDAVNRVSYELRKNPSRYAYFVGWEADGCPLIENGNNDLVFYMNHDKGTIYDYLQERIAETHETAQSLLDNEHWLDKVAQQVAEVDHYFNPIPLRFYKSFIVSALTLMREDGK